MLGALGCRAADGMARAALAQQPVSSPPAHAARRSWHARHLPSPCAPCSLQTEQRYRELTNMGVNVKLCLVGRKGQQYFSRRPQYDIVRE